MTDLRALLYDHWCPKCGTDIGPKHLDHTTLCPEGITAPLATRLPECVPPGLEKAELPYSHWVLRHQTATGPSDCQPVFGADPITDEQAELLFIGKAVKVLGADGDGLDLWTERGAWWTHRESSESEWHRGDTLIELLAATLHRLADGRKQETTS